ncbi:hypothetical protein HPB51_016942 [Rhipicephalus microplus]|uniref:Uncharacterized protein n=1 Tax=Rhipicephalus microplus TaxID=6941 RepID=A0A9J6F4J3_RHIMP|nr:hypothetical protein HPB51_016942 [Rhipicephalus microplus]
MWLLYVYRCPTTPKHCRRPSELVLSGKFARPAFSRGALSLWDIRAARHARSYRGEGLRASVHGSDHRTPMAGYAETQPATREGKKKARLRTCRLHRGFLHRRTPSPGCEGHPSSSSTLRATRPLTICRRTRPSSKAAGNTYTAGTSPPLAAFTPSNAQTAVPFPFGRPEYSSPGVHFLLFFTCLASWHCVHDRRSATAGFPRWKPIEHGRNAGRLPAVKGAVQLPRQRKWSRGRPIEVASVCFCKASSRRGVATPGVVGARVLLLYHRRQVSFRNKSEMTLLSGFCGYTVDYKGSVACDRRTTHFARSSGNARDITSGLFMISFLKDSGFELSFLRLCVATISNRKLKT